MRDIIAGEDACYKSAWGSFAGTIWPRDFHLRGEREIAMLLLLDISTLPAAEG